MTFPDFTYVWLSINNVFCVEILLKINPDLHKVLYTPFVYFDKDDEPLITLTNEIPPDKTESIILPKILQVETPLNELFVISRILKLGTDHSSYTSILSPVQQTNWA